MADTQETAREIVSHHAQEIVDEHVFIHPDIPPERLKAALDSYGEGIEEEDVLVFRRALSVERIVRRDGKSHVG